MDNLEKLLKVLSDSLANSSLEDGHELAKLPQYLTPSNLEPRGAIH